MSEVELERRFSSLWRRTYMRAIDRENLTTKEKYELALYDAEVQALRARLDVLPLGEKLRELERFRARGR